VRYYASILIVSILAGCVSAPVVPLPTVTDFDDNPKARAAYLEAYSQGYRARLTGDHSIYCSPRRGGIIETASEIGWLEGQTAARKAIIDRPLNSTSREEGAK
jgi:hypothetical protein